MLEVAQVSDVEKDTTPFKFSAQPGEDLRLSEAIGQALGFASVCWEPKPEGVFDSALAGQAADALLKYVEGNYLTDAQIATLIRGEQA